jgi:hypothetical protein
MVIRVTRHHSGSNWTPSQVNLVFLYVLALGRYSMRSSALVPPYLVSMECIDTTLNPPYYEYSAAVECLVDWSKTVSLQLGKYELPRVTCYLYKQFKVLSFSLLSELVRIGYRT